MIERNGDVLRVTGSILIAEVLAMLEAGRGFLRSGGQREFVLDLSAVEETDSSALSLIFCLLRTARQCGVSLSVSNPPASMISQASLYGVSDSLPLA